jgi:hypothetical protein
MDDYPLRITGNRFLDGVLWARGTRKSLTIAEVRLSSLPPSLMERIERAAQESGFETEFKEVPMKHSLELLMVMAGTNEMFRPLIKYGERRLVPGLPREFLVGYFMACARVQGLNEPEINPANVQMEFRPFHDPVDDCLEGLASLGVTSASPDEFLVTLDAEDYTGIAELESVRDAFIEEETQLRQEHGGTAIEVLAAEAFEQAGPASLTQMCQNLFARLQAVEDLRSRAKDDAATIQATRSPVLEQVASDYAALTGKAFTKEAVATVPNLRTLEGRYRQILGRHFAHSREYQQAKTMAGRLLDTIEGGTAPTDARTSLQAYFHVGGPTDDLVALFVARGPLSKLFHVGADGILLEATPAQARELRANLDERMLRETDTAMELLRGLTFSEADDRADAEILNHCGSCGERLVLASGQACSTCSTGLCQSCFVLYGAPQDNPNPFAAEARAAYCRVHANKAPKRANGHYTPGRIRALMHRAAERTQDRAPA